MARPVPISDETLDGVRSGVVERGRANDAAVAAWVGARGSYAERVVIGEGDPTGTFRPAEYVAFPSSTSPGLPSFLAVVELSDAERQAIADGGRLLLVLDRAEVPWSIDVEGPDGETVP